MMLKRTGLEITPFAFAKSAPAAACRLTRCYAADRTHAIYVHHEFKADGDL